MAVQFADQANAHYAAQVFAGPFFRKVAQLPAVGDAEMLQFQRIAAAHTPDITHGGSFQRLADGIRRIGDEHAAGAFLVFFGETVGCFGQHLAGGDAYGYLDARPPFHRFPDLQTEGPVPSGGCCADADKGFVD